jgi:hypothetical protein
MDMFSSRHLVIEPKIQRALHHAQPAAIDNDR